MKKLFISIFDRKAGSWSFPCQADNKATALRMFADLVSDNRTLVGQHPEDFDLFVVGSFDLSTGTVCADKVHLGDGREYVRNEVRN